MKRSSHARGYGRAHQAERARWQAWLNAGNIIPCACTRPTCSKHSGPCDVIITATSTWDLGHGTDRSTYNGPECVPCNRSAGGKNGNAIARQKRAPRTTFTREW